MRKLRHQTQKLSTTSPPTSPLLRNSVCAREFSQLEAMLVWKVRETFASNNNEMWASPLPMLYEKSKRVLYSRIKKLLWWSIVDHEMNLTPTLNDSTWPLWRHSTSKMRLFLFISFLPLSATCKYFVGPKKSEIRSKSKGELYSILSQLYSIFNLEAELLFCSKRDQASNN